MQSYLQGTTWEGGAELTLQLLEGRSAECSLGLALCQQPVELLALCVGGGAGGSLASISPSLSLCAMELEAAGNIPFMGSQPGPTSLSPPAWNIPPPPPRKKLSCHLESPASGTSALAGEVLRSQLVFVLFSAGSDADETLLRGDNWILLPARPCSDAPPLLSAALPGGKMPCAQSAQPSPAPPPPPPRLCLAACPMLDYPKPRR